MSIETKPQQPARRTDVSKLRPVEVHSSRGILVGAVLVKHITTEKPAARGRDGEVQAEEMAWHPLGVFVRSGANAFVVPGAALDRIEVKE